MKLKNIDHCFYTLLLGVPVDLKSETITIRAIFLLFTTDLQAKAIILEMIAHNGYCSCSYCDDPGHAPKNKKGKKQHAYAYDGTGNLRSSEQWKMDAQAAMASGKMVGWDFVICLVSNIMLVANNTTLISLCIIFTTVNYIFLVFLEIISLYR